MRIYLSLQFEQGVIGLTRGIKPSISHAICVRTAAKNPIFLISNLVLKFTYIILYIFCFQLLLAIVNMAFFIDKAREASGKGSSISTIDFANLYCVALIPTELCELPEVVVRDSIVSPDLGIEANPIVIKDDLAPLGSAINPFVIYVSEDFCLRA